MVAKSIWLLCCVALVAAGSDKGGKGDKKGDGEEKEEDVKDASGLRARVNSNDFCAKPISGEAIKAFISCPDVREYKMKYQRECMLKLLDGEKLKDVKCEFFKLGDPEETNRKIKACVKEKIDKIRRESLECQDRLLGSNPQRTIKVFEEHEAVTKHSDDVMDKFCDEKAELSDAAISAGLMCTEAAADFDAAMVKQCTADFWEDKADEKAQDMNEKRLGGYCDDRIRWRFEDTTLRCLMKKSGKQPKEQPEMPSEGRSYVIVDGKKELHPEEETMQMNRRLLFKSKCLEKALKKG